MTHPALEMKKANIKATAQAMPLFIYLFFNSKSQQTKHFLNGLPSIPTLFLLQNVEPKFETIKITKCISL